MSSLDKLLGVSVNTYQALKDATVLSGEGESPGNQDLKDGQQILLTNLIDSLEMTKRELATEVDQDRVSYLDSSTLDLLETACEEMEEEGTTNFIIS